jgi:sodium transport system permease protein
MKQILIVAKKELREMLRDKRVRTGAVIMPACVVLFTMVLFGVVISAVTNTKATRIDVVKTTNPLVAPLKKAFDLREVATIAEGQTLVKAGKSKLLLDFRGKNEFGQEVVVAQYDPKEQTGEIAFRTLQAVFSKVNEEALKVYLTSKSLPAESAQQVILKDQPIKVGEEKSANELVVSMLPYLIVLFTFTGGMAIAGDLVAGEKEKLTLETLLISPLKREHIVLGKMLSIAAICLLSSLSGLTGFVLASIIKIKGTEKIFADGLGITPAGFGLILLLLIPLVAFFASTLIAVSAYAKNSREAQTFLGVLNLVVVLPAVFTQIIGFTDFGRSQAVNLVPILNTANNIRAILMGKQEAGAMLITIAISFVIAAIGIWVAVRLFNREEVLTRV